MAVWSIHRLIRGVRKDERPPIAAYAQEDRFVLWNVIEDWWRRIRGSKKMTATVLKDPECLG